MDRKRIEIVAGPNGSGKTTFATALLSPSAVRTAYLNPDLIASGISTKDFERASFHAGRVLISEVTGRLNRGESFGFESTLSGRTWLHFLKNARSLGYEIRIYFLFLKSVEQNISRVKRRVKMGGHSIPTESILRRHPRCFSNFWNLYRPLADGWYVFENSKDRPRLLLDRALFDTLSRKKQAEFEKKFLRGIL